MRYGTRYDEEFGNESDMHTETDDVDNIDDNQFEDIVVQGNNRLAMR